MKAVYENNQEPGYGKFVFTEMDSVPDGPWSISLFNSQRLYASGRKDAPLAEHEIFVPVEGTKTGPNSFEAGVGPEIVDILDSQLNYRIRLKGENGYISRPVSCAVAEVTRSSDKGLAVNAPVEEEDEASVPAQDEHIPVKTEQEVTPASALLPETEKTESAGQENDSLEMAPPQRSGKKTLSVILFIALLCIACLVWFLVDKRGVNAPESRPQAGIEEQIRDFFNSAEKTPGLAVKLAESLKPETTGEKDAIYRLYYYGASKDDGQALLKYGECLDPATPPWGSIHKDGYLAWEAFSRAKAQNQAGAEAAIANLEKWLADAADKGNKEAAGWLAKISSGK